MSIATSSLPHDPNTYVVGVRFQKLGRLYHFDFAEFPDVDTGDFVIVETVRGLQMGQIMGFAEREENKRSYKPILRLATPRDMLLRQQWQNREVEMLITCRETAAKIGRYKHIKFVKAEFTFDGSSLTIMYATDDNFRPQPLLKNMQRKTKAKVEFRQIGPRDVARIMGGQGACGGPRCCSTFLTDFSPISIKMAKAQGVPLNPTEITGMCGRLRCCLIYEYEQYIEARKRLPKRNKVVGTPYGEGKVTEVFPIRDGVNVDVGGQYHFVEREEIIPLEEYRALQEKAEAGCSRSESGGCECGARRPRPAEAKPSTSAEVSAEEKPKRSRKRRRRSRRNKDSSTKQQSSSNNKGRRNRRRRSRRSRGGNDKKNDS